MATETITTGDQIQELSSLELFECDFCEVEEVNGLSHALLVALAAACVEKTSGTFNQRVAVLPGVKKEMLEYLNQQSQAYANGSSSLLRGTSSQVTCPTFIVKNMLETFIKSKRNMFSRFSGIVIDAHKDEKTDDFVHELDQTDMWLAGRREVLAKELLKRIDQKKTFHCGKTFGNEEEFAKHKTSCVMRPMTCPNEGCGDVYTALHADAHDASCAYKLLPCFLDCESSVQRKEMENHCATVCPMKKIKCPYHAVGCPHVMAQGLLECHCAEYVGQHLLETLQHVQSHDIALHAHAQSLLFVEKAVQLAQRSEAVTVGNMNVTLKEQENRVKLLEAEVKKLKENLKTTDVSAEVLQLRREFQDMQKQVESLSASSQSAR